MFYCRRADYRQSRRTSTTGASRHHAAAAKRQRSGPRSKYQIRRRDVNIAVGFDWRGCEWMIDAAPLMQSPSCEYSLRAIAGGYVADMDYCDNCSRLRLHTTSPRGVRSVESAERHTARIISVTVPISRAAFSMNQNTCRSQRRFAPATILATISRALPIFADQRVADDFQRTRLP